MIRGPNGSIYRALSQRGLDHWQRVIESGLYTELSQRRQIVATEQVDPIELGDPDDTPLRGRPAGMLRHARIPFVSYPYEWPFGMLKQAARLQLDVLLAALDREMTLKDSTPYNIQFIGASPVFIDAGSFDPQEPGRPWIGYRQFCMQFLYPLMLGAYAKLPFRPWLRGSMEGIRPAEMAAILSGRDRFRRGVFKHVHLHARLERRYASTGTGVRSELRRAGFGTEHVKANVRSVAKLVDRLDWSPDRSEWADYGETNVYDEREAGRKRDFVKRAAERIRPGLLWDLGCNDGAYTRVAARHADYTVAMDGDEAVVDRFYRSLREEASEDILPLVVDLADPSPAQGWRGRERNELVKRGKPDLVLSLALIHHLALSANIPLREVIDWLYELRAPLVVEFVTREDEMAKLLLSRKEGDPRPDYRLEVFERLLGDAFEVERREELRDGRRILFLARPRGG